MENIRDYLADFPKGKSIVDHIYVLRQIQEKCKEHDMKLYAVFIDFVKAYDSLHRGKLYSILEEFGVPETFIWLTMTLANTIYKVRVAGTLTEIFSQL